MNPHKTVNTSVIHNINHPALPPIGRGSRWLMGLLSAIAFLVPLVNLLAPIWSAAMAVHMLHGQRKSA